MKRDEALTILYQYVNKRTLINHMFSVEAAMRFYAKKLGQDEEMWGICGLLHDFDYEIHPDLDRHPQEGAQILKRHHVPDEIVFAILSHADHTGVPRNNLMRKALNACDEITGLITACVLVRPTKSIMDLSVKSVKKKWPSKHFAAGADRDEIIQAAADFGVELWEHVANVITAMQSIAGEISLDGSLLNQ